MTAKPAVAQWSRPLAALIVGRAAEIGQPQDQRRVQQAARFEVGQQLRERLVDGRNQPVFQRLEIVLVRVPAAVGDRDEPHAGFDQAAGQQAALAEAITAVGVAELVVFLVDLKRFLRLRSDDHVEGGPVVLVQGVKGRGLDLGLPLQLVDLG